MPNSPIHPCQTIGTKSFNQSCSPTTQTNYSAPFSTKTIISKFHVGDKPVPNPLSLRFYDHPLPSELISLFKVDKCSLCNLTLNNSEHYWGRKHFKVVQEYLEWYYSETPEVKPRFKPSPTYNRPLPYAIISEYSLENCGLCKKILTNYDESAQDHYDGEQHEDLVQKFLQNNPQQWREGFSTVTNISGPENGKSRKVTSKVAPASWCQNLNQTL